VGSFGDAKRADAARADLPALIGSQVPVGLVLLDEDQREQPVIQGQVIRVGADSVIFRRDGVDEEIPLGTIAKRVLGDAIRSYSERRPF
jgi:ribosome maturation factor RimP